ncbi:MAG: MerR family transcriptional regulator [Pseudomonadales bacterium]
MKKVTGKARSTPDDAQAVVERYTIRDLAEDFAVTTRALRFYEERGLLRPQRKGQSRVYSAADRVRLTLVLRGKRLGFTLDESAELIAMYDPSGNNEGQLQALINKIQEKHQRIVAQKSEIELMLSDLKEWEQRSRKALRELSRGNK